MMVGKQEAVLGAQLPICSGWVWGGMGWGGDEGSRTHPGGFMIGFKLQSQCVRFCAAKKSSRVLSVHC